MIDLVLKRGRAYRCQPCGYMESKSRVECHFYKKHVPEFEVPFMCHPCDFRTGDQQKFQRHQESPGHQEKMDPLMEIVALQVSQVPRFIKVGEDIIKLSKTESAKHWLEVSSLTDSQEQTGEEDLRVQLLTTEPMNVTPPQTTEPVMVSREETAASAMPDIGMLELPMVSDSDSAKVTDASTQTETEALDDIVINRVDSNLKVMNGYMKDTLEQVYKYIETLAEMNKRQEQMLLRLEKKLDSGERRQHEDDRDSNRRRERDYDRDRQYRSMKFRSRDRH